MGVETLTLAAMAASTVSGAVGAYEQGQAASKNAAYQAQVATINAKVAQQNAGYEAARGEQEAYNQQLKTRKVVGGMEAAQGANGLDVNSGSNLSVRQSAEEMGQTDVQTIQNNSSRQAWNYEAQAAGLTSESQLLKEESKQESLSSYVNAGSSILGGAGKFFATQYMFDNN